MAKNGDHQGQGGVDSSGCEGGSCLERDFS